VLYQIPPKEYLYAHFMIQFFQCTFAITTVVVKVPAIKTPIQVLYLLVEETCASVMVAKKISWKFLNTSYG